MRKKRDFTGLKFGRLTVIREDHDYDKGTSRQSHWLCFCLCGNHKTISANSLTKKNLPTKSCGCIQKEIARKQKPTLTHGLSQTDIYSIYQDIKKRCYNKKNKGYPYYGGRGIKMSTEWLTSFEQFFKDIGPRPTTLHSIDRIDNSKGYSKHNCRWATKKEQAANRRAFVGVSGYQYVRKVKRHYKYFIKNNNKWIAKGKFNTPKEAHQAYLDFKK